VSIADNQDGTYSISFVPDSAGNMNLDVFVRGVPIKVLNNYVIYLFMSNYVNPKILNRFSKLEHINTINVHIGQPLWFSYLRSRGLVVRTATTLV